MTEVSKEIYPTGPESKKPWFSKTLWVNAIMAFASFFPGVQDLITPDLISVIFLVVNTVLRFTTKKAISIK